MRVVQQYQGKLYQCTLRSRGSCVLGTCECHVWCDVDMRNHAGISAEGAFQNLRSGAEAAVSLILLDAHDVLY